MKVIVLLKTAPLIVLLSISGLSLTRSAAAQSQSPSAAVKSPATKVPSPPRHLTAQPKPLPSAIPKWLWSVLAGLALWNLLLSYLVWRHFETFDRKTYRNEKKIKELESKDIALDHRIDRRTADLEEMIRKLETHYDSGMPAQTADSLQAFFTNQVSPDSFNPDIEALDASIDESIDESNQQTVTDGIDQPWSTELDSGGDSSIPDVTTTEPWNSIVRNYRHSPQALESFIIAKVSETEDSLTHRQGDSNASVQLKPVDDAQYWIFNSENQKSWLVPKSDLKLTPTSYDTFQALFECQAYQPNLLLQILRPARVVLNATEGTWDLVEKGQAQFAG